MPTRRKRAEKGELAALFFLQAMATGIWIVPLSPILQAHGYAALRPYAFATTAVAALLSPLVFGAMADRHVPPVVVLRWLSAASAASLAVATWSIARGWPPGLVLALIQVFAMFAAPTGSIASTVVFSRLEDSQREFGPLRAMATLGWMSGCWLVSALGADTSPVAGWTGTGVWLALAIFTFLLPEVPPPVSTTHSSFRERMGWDAIALLRNHDHRVVYVTAALFSIPLAAFYPFTPPQLQELGLVRTSAWMTLGQISEIAVMLCLAGLFARWRLKWIFAAGMAAGVLRYTLGASDQKTWVLLSVSLHGCTFAMFFITAQIYLNERVEPAWRARAQAMLSLMKTGIGNLVGFLGTGFWLRACTASGKTHWPVFWGGLAIVIALVLVYFLFAYHGRGGGLLRKKETSET